MNSLKKFNRSFMRTEFSEEIDEDCLLKEAKSVLPPRAEVRLNREHQKNMVIPATKEYHP